MSDRVFDVKVARKGQIVIPKVLRDRFRIRENSRVRLIAVDDGVLIKPAVGKPWVGLRGMLKGKISPDKFEGLLEEAQKSLFKVQA